MPPFWIYAEHAQMKGLFAIMSNFSESAPSGIQGCAGIFGLETGTDTMFSAVRGLFREFMEYLASSTQKGAIKERLLVFTCNVLDPKTRNHWEATPMVALHSGSSIAHPVTVRGVRDVGSVRSV
jgi:hypothetical protein